MMYNCRSQWLYQMGKMMKLLTLFLLTGALSLSANSLAQNQKVTLEVKDCAVIDFFRIIQEKTQLYFVYNMKNFQHVAKVNVKAEQEELKTLLDRVFKEQKLEFIFESNTVIVRQQQSRGIKVSGLVSDEKSDPLPGVTVLIKGTQLGVSTDVDGKFNITVPSGNHVLIFTMIGMETVEVGIQGKEKVNVVMKMMVNELEDVVVTGIFKKARESYTGAVTSISSKEMKMFRGQNMLSTLKNIDPSINFVINNNMGSDPNALPEINIRGNSSLPMSVEELNFGASRQLNAPLVIMDGFEISLEKLMDFNDEEIESINILKDAAATAIYGSRGANGVIVVITKSPKAGKMKVYASVGCNVEIPDLSSYHLLNAADKLALEKEVGFFEDKKDPGKDQNLKMKYYALLSEVLRGVDTDWLSKPLRIGVGQRYNLRLEGGSDAFRWAVSLGQNSINGVMKSSERNNFTGSITLSYTYKNVVFKNQTTLDFNKAENSKYGKFSTYADLNPYWRVKDEQGEYIKNYQYSTGGFMPIGNPLYDARLNIRDESRYNQTTNNFSLEWDVVQKLTLRVALGLSKQNNSSDYFLPPGHSSFSTKDYQEGDKFSRKGKYDYKTGELVNLNGNVTLSYNKLWADKHLLYAGVDYFISERKSHDYNISVEGFSSDEMDFLGNALQYKEGGKPLGNESTTRQVGFTGNLNYTYDNRYYADFSYRVDGSSQFGSKKRFAPFWSAGIGWNMHHESFLKNWNFLDKCRLRLSYGETGSVKFSSYQALSMFKYYQDDRYLIYQGADLQGLGNENLKWQVTGQWNAGLEWSCWNGLFSASLDVYHKKTSNLLSQMDLVPSSGFASYTDNVGAVKNVGFEAMLSTYLIRNTQRRIIWMVSGRIAHNKNEITKLSDAIKLRTEEYKNNNMEITQLLCEGYSQSAIYAVPSLGIDPSTGKELFLDRYGNITDVWASSAKRYFGDTEAKFRGNINTMFRYRDLTLNVSFGYRWGGQQYNETLLRKVEVVKSDIKRNVDYRVLTDRWQKPGDIKQFKAYGDERTKASSRFVMDDNVFELQAIGLQYRWNSSVLQRFLGLETVNFDVNMSDVFYISSVKRERGISYPFAWRVNFSIGLIF